MSLNAKAFRPWEYSESQSTSSQRNTSQHIHGMNTFVPPFYVNNPTNPVNVTAQDNPMLIASAPPNAELASWQALQAVLDQKINDAKHNKTKVRFEDMIEDNQQDLPTQDDQETIKFICNNTGKNNFEPKLEDLKQVVRPSEVNLKWFINYILTKRISVQYQKQQHIYIDLVR